MPSTTPYLRRLHQLIAKDELKTVMTELQKLLQDSPAYDELLLQSARYTDVMKSIRMNTLDWQRADIEKNRIRHALIDMVRELEENLEQQEGLKAEVAKHLEKQSNNTAHISGDGNINLQGLSGSSVNIQINQKPEKE